VRCALVEKAVFEETIIDPAQGEQVIAEAVSFEEFLTRFGEYHAEWVGGKVILVVSNNTVHQFVLGFVYGLLSAFMSLKPLGKLLLAGIPMNVGQDRPAREPDLILVLNANLARIQPTFLNGPADIAVEIVSPESTERDRGRKFGEYEAAGVQEYWLFDPQHREAAVYTLSEDGTYRRLPLNTDGHITSLLLPGFALNPEILWRDELPNMMETVELARQMASPHP
jgi:Uma2 family endonuclease